MSWAIITIYTSKCGKWTPNSYLHVKRHNFIPDAKSVISKKPLGVDITPFVACSLTYILTYDIYRNLILRTSARCACNSETHQHLKGHRRCGFLPAVFPSFEAHATEADLKLFKSISSNPFHVLRHYLRQREPTGYGLRPRAHGFALPAKDDRNFIPRLLYGVLTHPN